MRAGTLIIADRLNPAADRLLVVALHGYGGTGVELVQVLSAADTAESAVVLGLDGPYEPTFSRAGRAWFPATSQLSVIAQRAHELAPAVSQYVTEVQERYRITADRTCLVGFSQGASVAAAVLELSRFRMTFGQVALPGLGHEFTHEVARLALAHSASELQWSGQ